MGALTSQADSGRRAGFRVVARLVASLFLLAALLGHPAAFADVLSEPASTASDCHAGAPAGGHHEPASGSPDGMTTATGCCFLHGVGVPAAGVGPTADPPPRAATSLGPDDGRHGLTVSPPLEPPRPRA